LRASVGWQASRPGPVSPACVGCQASNPGHSRRVLSPANPRPRFVGAFFFAPLAIISTDWPLPTDHCSYAS
jgi:hypothetical protein